MRICNFVLFEKKNISPEIPQPVEKAVNFPVGEVAWSESSLYSGVTVPKYNPDDLIGLRGARIYKRMMQDEQVKAVVRFKRDAITGREWYFEFDEDDLKVAEASDAMGQMPDAPKDPGVLQEYRGINFIIKKNKIW